MVSSSATTPADGAILPGARAMFRFASQQRLSASSMLVLLALLPTDVAPVRLYERDVIEVGGRDEWRLADAWECMSRLHRRGLVDWHHDPRGDAQESITLSSQGELLLMALFGAVMLGGEEASRH